MARAIKLYRYVKNADGTTSKVWTGRYRIRWFDANGKQQSDVFASEKAANAALAKRIVERDEIRAGVKRERSNQTLREVAAEWLKTRPEARRVDDESHLDHHILPFLGDLRMPQVVPKLEAFKRHLEAKKAARPGQKTEKPLQPATIASVCRTLSKLLRDVNYECRISVKVPRQPFKWIEDPNDARKLVDVCRPEWFRVCVALAIYSGLRKGEICALKRSDLDLDRGTIRVERSHKKATTKGKSYRRAPLPAELATILRPWLLKHPGPYVVTQGGKPLTESTDLARRTKRACKRAGIAAVHFHALRHTAGSYWGKTNSVMVVRDLLGHKDIATTQKYMHTDEDIALLPTAQISLGTPPAGQVVKLETRHIPDTASDKISGSSNS